jgi:hypothetical protein
LGATLSQHRVLLNDTDQSTGTHRHQSFLKNSNKIKGKAMAFANPVAQIPTPPWVSAAMHREWRYFLSQSPTADSDAPLSVPDGENDY